MADISTLRRQVLNYRTLALSAYDRYESTSVIGRLAHMIDNRTAKDNPVRLTETFHFPQAYRWDDEVTVGAVLDKIDFVVPIDGWESFFPYNEVNIGRPGQAYNIKTALSRTPISLFRSKVRAVMEVFRTNPVAMDGQDFFSAVHPYPADEGTYSNIIPLGFADPANPTFDEIRAFVSAAQERLREINALEAEVTEVATFEKSLLITVHNPVHATLFNEVLRREKINDEENTLRNSFVLLQDQKPTAGQENWIEVTHSEPEGPLPAFLVIDEDPQVKVWETNKVPNGYIAVGMRDQWGLKPGFPHTTVQGQG